MMRVETFENCTLYCGDALEIMPTIAPVDCVITDPPYRVSKGGFASNNQLQGGFGGWMREYGNGGDIVPCDIEWQDWLPIVYAALKPNTQAYFMTNGKSLAVAQCAAMAAGFDLHTILVWDKRSALPNRWYQNVTEFALFMKKGVARTINNPSAKNLYSIFQRDETNHPTEKPVLLMHDWVLNSTNAGDVVLDPFMGSGTTGVACTWANDRHFIGIEKDPIFFDMACRRIENAIANPPLFKITTIQPQPIQAQSAFEV